MKFTAEPIFYTAWYLSLNYKFAIPLDLEATLSGFMEAYLQRNK